MDVVDIVRDYDNDRLYNIEDVINEFSLYFGFSFNEMIDYFSKYFIISREEVFKYLKDIYKNSDDIEKIINDRIKDYNYYSKVLEILEIKALRLLDLLSYLSSSSNINKNNNNFEIELEKLQIYHYSSIVVGRDVNRILVVIFHILNKFHNALVNVNDVNMYKIQRVDSFALRFGYDDVYPSLDLVVDDYKNDKTSFKVRKRSDGVF